MAKRIKLNLLKTRESYSSRRLAETLNVHIRTVQEWKSQGLKPISNTIPLFFMGFEVKEFLQQRQKINKIKLEDNQFYCMKCRKAVSSKDNKIEIIITGKEIGRNSLKEFVVKGFCETCGCKLNRFSHEGKLQELENTFNITSKGEQSNEQS